LPLKILVVIWSQNERNLIISSLDQPENTCSEDFSIPWRHVMTSGPFLAIFVAHVCSNFGWYMLLIELPTYMKQVLKFDIQQVSFNEFPQNLKKK
jgi:MFS transporter, ACS family, solute carrier family 17 (sodium-dependent inorganic phosphate cotransporter), other